MPCNSAALRRMPACFIATFRSGPGGIVRACSSAASASASRSSFGRGFLFGRGMEPKIRRIIPACLFGARLWNQSGDETAIAMEHYGRYRGSGPLNRRRRKPWLSAGVIGGAQRKECPMIRHLAVIGTLAAFAGAQSSAPSAQNTPSTSSDKSSTTTSQIHTEHRGHHLAGATEPGAADQQHSDNSFQQRRDDSFAGSIYPAPERALSGSDNTAPPTNNQTQAAPPAPTRIPMRGLSRPPI